MFCYLQLLYKTFLAIRFDFRCNYVSLLRLHNNLNGPVSSIHVSEGHIHSDRFRGCGNTGEKEYYDKYDFHVSRENFEFLQKAPDILKYFRRHLQKQIPM